MPETGELGRSPVTAKLTHWPAADGIRALAILMVLLYHWGEADTALMFFGVTLFFVLSGFLITTLLVSEWDRDGAVDLRRFYTRRAFRLLPAVFVASAALVVLSVVSRGWTGMSPKHAIGIAFVIVFYLANFSAAAGVKMNYFIHTWSLALEEQFYLLWPMTLLALLRRNLAARTIEFLALGAFVVSGAWRAVVWASGATVDRTAFAPDTRVGEIFLGCALALFVWSLDRPLSNREATVVRWLGNLGVLGLALHMVLPSGGRAIAHVERYDMMFGFSVVALCGACMVASIRLTPGGWWQALLSTPLLRWVGRISYGLYLWHFPVYYVVRVHLAKPLHVHGYGMHLVQLALAFVVAQLSWSFLEQPFLRLRDRRAKRDTAPITPIG